MQEEKIKTQTEKLDRAIANLPLNKEIARLEERLALQECLCMFFHISLHLHDLLHTKQQSFCGFCV